MACFCPRILDPDSSLSPCPTISPLQLLLLENVRFYKEEEKNDAEFAKKVSSMASSLRCRTVMPVRPLPLPH